MNQDDFDEVIPVQWPEPTREEYEREQIATAQSEADFEANIEEYRK